MSRASEEGWACLRLRPWLAAYADGSIDPDRAGSVEDHLLACLSCDEEVSALRRVRSLLGSQIPEQGRPSPDLATRLVSIAGSSQAGDPLWLKPGEGSILPSRRQLRFRRARLALGAGAAMVLCLLMVTNLMVIDARIVTDPGRTARADFTAWLTSDTMNQSVAVVLLAQSQGADLTQTMVEPDRPFWTVPTRAVSMSEISGELDFLNRISFSVSGEQRVSVATEAGWVVARVLVEDRSGQDTTMTVLDQADREFLTQRSPGAGERNQLMTTPGLSLRVSQPGAVVLLGRSAQLVEAVWQDAVVARWWVDPVDELLLWTERYSEDGALEISAGYEDLTPGAQNISTSTAEKEMTGFPGPSAVNGAWCVVLDDCPDALAGLPLVSHTRSGTADAPMMRMVYSDGMTTIVVVAQPGFLSQSGVQANEYSVSGVPQLLAWQSGETVISVASNGSRELLREARSALPNQAPEHPDVWWRIRTGFGRLFGLR